MSDLSKTNEDREKEPNDFCSKAQGKYAHLSRLESNTRKGRSNHAPSWFLGVRGHSSFSTELGTTPSFFKCLSTVLLCKHPKIANKVKTDNMECFKDLYVCEGVCVYVYGGGDVLWKPEAKVHAVLYYCSFYILRWSFSVNLEIITSVWLTSLQTPEVCWLCSATLWSLCGIGDLNLGPRTCLADLETKPSPVSPL